MFCAAFQNSSMSAFRHLGTLATLLLGGASRGASGPPERTGARIRALGTAPPEEVEETLPRIEAAASTVATSIRLIAACAIVALLQFAAPVLMPIVVSVILFYALDPIVDQ